MKKLLAISTLVAGLLLVTACGSSSTEVKEEGSNTTQVAKTPGVIFEMTDAIGDDKGPGNYTYPTDKVFVPGAFDITGFKVKDGGSTYDFIFTINADFKNDWKNAGGWDVQMFDVYLNLGTGKHKQTLSGRNVKINGGWDKGLLIGSAKPSRMQKELDDKNGDVADDISDFEDLTTDVMLPDEISVEGNMLTAKIAKEKLGDLAALTGVQAFSLGSEGYPNKRDTYNRVVNEYSAQWRFGGGTDYDGDTNVIDMLGDNSKLSGYKSEEGVAEFASIDLVKTK